MQPIRVLLEGIVDYAGLFPPAGLEMGPAVAAYAGYRRGPDRWMLGRFIVPVGRLGELESAAAPHLTRRPTDDVWPVSGLAGDDLAADVSAIGEFNCRHAADEAGAAEIDTVEVRASDLARIAEIARLLPSWATGFVEVPLEPDPEPLIAAIGRAGLHAKIRTGGVTPESIPPAPAVARFLAGCVRNGVAFKATAGLHHPLRAEHPLTYAPDAPRAVMHGYLNVFLAAAVLRDGGSEADAARLLDERDPAAFAAGDSAIRWRDRRLDARTLADARALARSFGSCSFTEPVADLAALNLG